MANNQTACLKAVTQQYKSLLFLRMFGVIDQAGMLIKKSSLRLFERDAVLLEILLGLARLPGKFYIAHSIILAISRERSQESAFFSPVSLLGFTP
jgi:hypothetical protein